MTTKIVAKVSFNNDPPIVSKTKEEVFVLGLVPAV